MKILVFGSMNYDYVYEAPHFVGPGETLASSKMSCFCGGKGFNQAVAISRAGEKVSIAGAVGEDGGQLLSDDWAHRHLCLLIRR